MIRLIVPAALGRMQRAKHNVARFGCRDRRFDRFQVSHFTHQNHVGVHDAERGESPRQSWCTSTPTSRWLTVDFLWL